MDPLKGALSTIWRRRLRVATRLARLAESSLATRASFWADSACSFWISARVELMRAFSSERFFSLSSTLSWP